MAQTLGILLYPPPPRNLTRIRYVSVEITSGSKSFYKPDQRHMVTVTDCMGLIWGSVNKAEMKQDQGKKNSD